MTTEHDRQVAEQERPTGRSAERQVAEADEMVVTSAAAALATDQQAAQQERPTGFSPERSVPEADEVVVGS